MKVSSSFVSRRRPFEVREKMSMRQRIALVLAVVSISMIGTGLGTHKAMAEPPVRADGSATGTNSRGGVVSPGTSLTNEVVTVSWSGFTPTLPNGLFGVLIVQCKGAPVTMADCYTAEPYPDIANGTRASSTTGSDGTGSTRIEIRPASNLPLLNCSASNSCTVMAYENDGQSIPPGGLPVSRVVVPITFAPSQADCPNITDFDVRADGSATSATLFYDWAARLCNGDNAVVVDYTENSSTTGRENFLNGLTDFAVSGLPATEEELMAHPEHREFSYIPLVASATVIAYNFTDPFTGQPLDNVVLSPRLVARIVTNSSLETFFQDRELLRLNPGVRFPTSVLARPNIRAERNADTRIVTNWFAADADAQLFLTNSDRFRATVSPEYIGYQYPQDLFESVSQDSEYLPRQGQRNVALRLFYGVKPTGILRENTSTTGVIGVMDLPTARRFGLKIAKIVNPNGTVVEATDEAILKGVADMDISAEGFYIPDPTPEDLNAYPLAKVEYALVPNTFPTQTKVDKVLRLLNYGLNEGQTSLPSGFVALPETLKISAISAIASVSIPTTTTTTTTTTTSTTTVAPKKKYVPPATTTVAPTTTTTTSTTTTSTTTTSTTTTLAPITVPKATSDLPGSGSSKSGVLYTGLIGLSGAALIGTVKPRKKVAKA
jgi:ABC-type phosphate transport system substrate-binding protein